MMAYTGHQSSNPVPISIADNLDAKAVTPNHIVSDAVSASISANEQLDRQRTPGTVTNQSAAVTDQPTVLSDQLDALTELPINPLRQHWSRLYKTQPPLRMSRDLLLLAISWKLQARSLGGLGASDKRKLAEIARKLDSEDNVAALNAIRLKPGTKLIREWHGDIHEILVLETGFEWNGDHHRSLTQIAFQITGAHWSGPRFFGLKAKQNNFTKTKVLDREAQENA
jgi:hypothetical protein